MFITETPGREVYFESGLRQKINPTETKKRIKIFYHNFFFVEFLNQVAPLRLKTMIRVDAKTREGKKSPHPFTLGIAHGLAEPGFITDK